METIERALFREKVARDDSASYIGSLLVRQRLVNETVVSFGQEYLQLGGRVIDACAGPEGSWLASAKRGYEWVGNDICLKFSQILEGTGGKVVLADFAHAPFKEGVADGVFFIFALNNIYNPKAAFSEAFRITHERGVVIETEPGLSAWTSRILLHSLLTKDSNHEEYLQKRDFSSQVVSYFEEKPYTEHEYTDFIIRQTLGTTRGDLSDIARRSVASGTKKAKAHFRFHEEVTRLYFRNMEQATQQAGFKVVKAGILAIAQGRETGTWEVSHPVQVGTSGWLEQLSMARMWKRNQNPLLNNFPYSMDKVAKRIVVPILCLQKTSSVTSMPGA